MDKFLVDLDSVLDRLEAEDADRCSTENDEPCDILDSKLYRNSVCDKSKQVGFNHHHREPNTVKSNDTDLATASGGLDFLLPSEPKSSKISLENDLSGKLSESTVKPESSDVKSVIDSVISQIEHTETQHFNEVSCESIEKKSVTGTQHQLNSSGDCLNDAVLAYLGSTADDKNITGDNEVDSQLINYDYGDSLTSHQDNRIQQSVNLEQTSNYNSCVESKQGLGVKIGLSSCEKDESVLNSGESASQLKDKSMAEKIDSIVDPNENSINDDRMDLLRNPTSYYNSASTSTTTSTNIETENCTNLMQSDPDNQLSNFHSSSLLISSQTSEKSEEPHINLIEDVSTEEEMTEEEEKAMEKELESELQRLNYQSESNDLEKDEIESKMTTASTSSTTSSTQSSPLTSTSSPLSTSSSVSVSLSKSNVMPESNSGQNLDCSSESHQSPTNESSNNGNTNETRREEENPNNSGNNDINVFTKPIRPASLPISNSTQSNQPESVNELPPSPPPTSSYVERDVLPENVQAPMSSIGYFKPFWIPDEEAYYCMICEAKFTVMKRRHHCRACGKVLCAQCSRGKAPLAYLSFKEARVCNQCLPLLTEGVNNSGHDNSQILNGQQQHGAEGLQTPSAPPSHQLSSASTSSSLVARASAQPQSSSSTIQPVSVLRRSSKPRGEPKQVIFSDGIRPGNDLKDDQVTSVSHRRHAKKVKSPPIEKNPSSPGFTSKSRNSNRIVIQDANGQLPPIINNPSLQSNPSLDNLMSLLEQSDEPPITFSLTKNLMALVKLVKLDCCTNEHCWTFTSRNLAVVGQDEIIVVLEKLSGENTIPRDIFRLFAYIYDSASKGFPFSELSHILNPEGFFGCKDFPGFVFIRPTFQCLNKITLPSAPFLVGVLIHKFEVPWAKLFPLRLILRLGSKYRCYPCPVVSYRQRRPSYFEIGHTVMDILADFRNFQYTLPVIPGLTIHTEAKRTTVTFPKNRYDKVMKALGSSNEYVLSFGGTFSLTADSHLTCIQNDDGQYHTQTIKLPVNESEPKVTGASFIVFSGALKSSTGMMAKMSVVEDGLLVQVTANTLNSLKSSLKDMKDFTIECGKKDNPTSEESVSLVWGEDDKQFNLRVRSCIDGLPLEGIRSIRMYNGTDFEGDKFLIRWVELFLIQNTELPRSGDGYDAGRAAEIIAQSFCPALVPCLESLVDNKINKIGLRVTLDSDKIGYDVGSNGSPLPPNYVDRLDAALVPIIMGNIAPNLEVRLVIELIFYILVK